MNTPFEEGGGGRIGQTLGWALVGLSALALCGFAVLGSFIAAASERAGAASAESCALFDHGHATWNDLLGRYVRDGSVAYGELRRHGATSLQEYLRGTESVCRDDYQRWSREQKLAFWINAYNAYTVQLILKHYPLGSIREIGVLPGAAFRERFLPLTRLRGEVLSLNDVEHDILRKEFAEPRIHFAIVCASKSCPALRGEAYRADSLDAQLTDAAKTFIADRAKNRFDAPSQTAFLSSIFDWFRDDFERASKTLPAYVAAYAEPAFAKTLSSPGVNVKFLDYDWSLNGK